MSGRLGQCVICDKWHEGIYSMECSRGWSDDKYDFHAEICEDCLERFVNTFKAKTERPDKTYINFWNGFIDWKRIDKKKEENDYINNA